MKKIILLLLASILFYACLDKDNDTLNVDYEIIKIDAYTVPTSFTFGQKDTIKLKYSLKDGCTYFDNIYYEYQDTARIVAVKSITYLDNNCTQAITQQEYNLIVTARQEQDYVFKFYKGIDANGNSIFEEAVVPVN